MFDGDQSMSLSLYDACVPAFLQGLTPLGGLIDKASEHCAERSIDEAVLCGSSLAPDMWPFAKQVMSACQHSAGAVAGAMSGENGPDGTPGPRTFDALSQQVAAALESLNALTPSQLEAVEGGDVTFSFGERKMIFAVPDYLLSFAMPNFYFHMSMTYAVLRNQGLAIGKRDFLGKPRMKV